MRETPEQVAAALTDEIALQAEQALAERSRYVIVLAGGSTPRLLYGMLRRVQTDWDRWHVYFSDERCVARDDPRRNDAMARAVWLEHVPVRAEHIHSIPAELGADAAAAAYAQAVHSAGVFDTALLGLGEDGHTASLFPGRPTGAERGALDVLAVHHAPKPPPERVSLSAARLSASRSVLMLATGDAKRAAVGALHGGADIPAAAIAPARGVDVWLDAAAAVDVPSHLPPG